MFAATMSPFIQNISSFPTAIYTVLLGVGIVFWLVATLGLVDLDIMDFDMDLDIDLDGIDVSDTPDLNEGVLPGLLLRFGLVGVPVTVSLTLLVMVGWLVCYYTAHLLFPLLPGAVLHYAVGVPVFIVSLYIAAKITGFLVRPLKPFFAKASQQVDKKVLGQTAIVRTSRVDNDFGEALLDDGGAGLIMKVRTKGDDRFSKGDRVVILERLNDDNIYRVISEEEFFNEIHS